MVSFKVLEKQRLEQQLATAEAATTESAAIEAKIERFDHLRKAIALKVGRSFKQETLLSGASDALKIECVSMGFPALDEILGGGLPRGHIVEAFGQSGAGKTTLALHGIAKVQQEGGHAVFIDAEHRLNTQYAQAVGVDIHALGVSRPLSGEKAFDTVYQLVRSGSVDIVVIDSVAALIPETYLGDNLSDSPDGYHSELMSRGLQRLSSELNRSESCCSILFLNQIRLQHGTVYGSPELPTGGSALGFYASVRLDLRRIQTLKRRHEEYGIKAKIKVVKSSVASPFRTAEMNIAFGKGIEGVEVVQP